MKIKVNDIVFFWIVLKHILVIVILLHLLVMGYSSLQSYNCL